MKSVLTILLASSILSGCSTPIDGSIARIAEENRKEQENSRFISQRNGDAIVVLDKQTGCKYIQTTYDTALTPLLNPDGKTDCSK